MSRIWVPFLNLEVGNLGGGGGGGERMKRKPDWVNQSYGNKTNTVVYWVSTRFCTNKYYYI